MKGKVHVNDDEKGVSIMKTKLVLISASIIFFCVQVQSFAATYAYLFTYDKVYKIDVAQSRVVSSKELPYDVPIGLLKKSVFYDKRNNSLLIIQGKKDTKISVIDLKTFQLKKDLEVNSPSQDSDLPTVIIPPDGNDFFIKWIDRQTSQEMTSKFSNVDFKKIEDITNYPSFAEVLGYSSDASEFYSFKISTPRELKIYDRGTIDLRETRNLDNIFIDRNKPWDIEGYTSGMVLFSESSTSIPSDPQNSDIFYAYKIDDKTITPRINTNTKGDNALLSPNKKYLLISESIFQFMTPSFFESINTGKITIFNIESGEKIGAVNIQADKFCKINGVSPDSTKAYVISKVPLSGEYKLSIIDLINKSIITEIPKVSFGREMIFFEE